MRIIYTKSYDKSIKDLKKKKDALDVLDEIINYIIRIKTFNEMLEDPYAKLYGLERLKHNLNEFYSFRLSKTIRLIVKPKDNYIELYFVYISTKHYDDFSIEKVIYYD